MSGVLDDLIGPKKEPSIAEQFSKDCKLSRTTRMYGFGIFFAIGAALTIISAFMVPNIATGHPERFAIPYAFGAIASLCSSLFLMGPVSQCKSMFAKTRIIATVSYLCSIVLTLVMALVLHSTIGVLFAIVFQLCALFWYSISFIPYARDAFCSCCKSVVSV